MAKESSTVTDSFQSSAIEYTSAIFGIYWGVWLSLFVVEMIEGNVRSDFPLLELIVDPYGFILFYILISLYTLTIVKIMIHFRYVNPERTIKYFGKVLKKTRIGLFTITTVAVISGLSWLFQLDIKWLIMGVWSSLGWVILLGIVAISDWKIKL